MIISPKYKFIFIKTQKTAGSSIEKILLDKIADDENLIFGGMPPENMDPINLDEVAEHRGRVFISRRYPDAWTNYYKFTVERNSWDKVVSYYHWVKKRNPKRTAKGFDTFVMDGKKTPYLKDWEEYTYKDKPIVDFVIQHHNLNDDFTKVMNTLGLPYNNELLTTKLKGNLRTEKDYKVYYNDMTKNRVGELYRKVIEEFNYVY